MYVSCDPATLARDLRALLAAGYAIESITLVDLLSADLSSRDSGPDAASLIGWKAIDPFQSSGVMESDSATPGPSAGAHVPPGAKTRPWSSLPLFHAAWLFALGIVAAKLIWLRPSVVLVALAMMAVLCAMAATRAQRVSWLALAPFWVLLGAWCAEMEPQPAPAPALGALSDGLLRTVEGIVLDAGPVRGQIEDNLDQASAAAPKQKPTQRIDLRVESIENVTDDQDAQMAADGGSAADGTLAIAAGTAVPMRRAPTAIVRLLPPEVYRDPGAWSREEYLLDQGITSTATLDSERVERLSAAPSNWFGRRAAVESLHCRLSEAQRTASNRLLGACPRPRAVCRKPVRINDEDAIMLAAMVTGDRTFLSHSLRVGFERTGSFHMLVVSGFHLAIMAGCIFWIAQIAAPPARSGHFDHHRCVVCLRAVHGVCRSRAAFAVDGDAVPDRAPFVSRTQPSEHHRIRCLVPAGREPAQRFSIRGFR